MLFVSFQTITQSFIPMAAFLEEDEEYGDIHFSDDWESMDTDYYSSDPGHVVHDPLKNELTDLLACHAIGIPMEVRKTLG